jgi:ribosome-associated translation inhibitor RaiA
MPLPKISTPTYELELPSTGQKLTYRPFLVREEKLLVLAMESENTKDITRAIKEVLKACIKTKVKVETLPTFDIEYLFLNIRGKSVGEEVEVSVLCPDDEETSVDVTIPIDDIVVQRDKEHDDTIILDDTLSMKMKYPSLDQFIETNFDVGNEKGTQLEQSFNLIASCIDSIYSEEEAWTTSECSKKELNEFLEQLSSTQFQQIEKFFETMPKLSYELSVTNPKTKKKGKVTLEGLASFFG